MTGREDTPGGARREIDWERTPEFGPTRFKASQAGDTRPTARDVAEALAYFRNRPEDIDAIRYGERPGFFAGAHAATIVRAALVAGPGELAALVTRWREKSTVLLDDWQDYPSHDAHIRYGQGCAYSDAADELDAALAGARPAAEPDEMAEHFIDANERMGEAITEIGMALGFRRPGVGNTWGTPEILAKIAEDAAPRRAAGPDRATEDCTNGHAAGCRHIDDPYAPLTAPRRAGDDTTETEPPPAMGAMTDPTFEGPVNWR